MRWEGQARFFACPREAEGEGGIENPFYTPEFHGQYEMFSLGDFVLEEGYTLRDLKLAYATFGELNEAKDNAILVTTWYSGTHQIFRDAYIGPDHALDPKKYFIVVINQIGIWAPYTAAQRDLHAEGQRPLQVHREACPEAPVRPTDVLGLVG